MIFSKIKKLETPFKKSGYDPMDPYLGMTLTLELKKAQVIPKLFN